MATNTYLSTIESKNQSKQTEQKQNHEHREHFDGCQMGGGGQGMDKKDEGIKKYKLVVTK